MEFLIIVGLILLNGVFSMSEIAIISAKKTTLKSEAKKGNKSAEKARQLQKNPNNFLSTIQIGITLIGIVTGLYSGDVLAVKLSPIFESWGMARAYSYPISKVLIVILVTYLSILFGELVPKRLGMSSAEKIAKLIARPMDILSKIAKPLVWILSKSTAFVFSLFGIKEQENTVTEEEIKAMIHEGTSGGEVQQVEQEIMERVFNLGDRKLESIMTPRREIVFLDLEMSPQEIKEILMKNSINKFPVTKGGLDQIEGIVYLVDIFSNLSKANFNLKEIIRPVQYFYESMEVYNALETMRTSHNHIALVIDEFGTLSGIVTLKDIMEAIVGEIPEQNEEPEIVKQKDGSYIVDGQCSFYNFLDYFKKVDLYQGNDYNTISGLLLENLGHLPHPGEYLDWHDFHFEVLSRDGARIDKVIVLIQSPVNSRQTTIFEQ